jgi:eukaryotic-like serine/threonine-protein kinase
MKRCSICKKEHKPDEPCQPTKDRHVSSDLLIGRLLDGKYELEYLISRGGMASIYCARRRQIGDLVAVKVLKLDENLDPVDLKRFQLEAAAAASIKHQNIVAVYDFGVLDDIAYLVMERLEGPALSKEIRACGTIPLERAITIFKQVCAAVTAAHKQGVVHRDLKPSNIIFQRAGCEDDLIKVVDFGIAKLIRNPKGEKLTTAEFAVGTPEYMSPEQCLGHKLDERSDIYSLGIVLYEILTSEVPFYNPVASAILVQHAIETPRPLSRLNPEIPPEIDAVVLKALEKNPDKRYRSALEMSTEFELACRSVLLTRQRSGSQPAYQEEEEVNGTRQDKSGTVRPPSISKREPLPFNTGMSLISSPTDGIKPFTGSRSQIRFSFERFVGRGEELKRLEERFEQVMTGLGRTVFITGDPGVGKTELVSQFQRRLGQDVLFLGGKFYEYGGDNPYRPYLDGLYSFVRNYSEQFAGESPDPVIKGLTTKIKQGLDEIDRVLDVSYQAMPPSTEEKIKYQTFELLTKIFVTISTSIPVVLFLDDVHWANSLSLEFLAYLVRNTEKNPILVLCTARSAELSGEVLPIRTWLRRISRYRGYDNIKLGSLSNREVRALIDSIFGSILISEAVTRKLCEVSEGNPYYLGEIIRQLIQEQKIFWIEDHWQCADIEELELPGSILDLVELHLNRLTDETIEVFTRAAVMGEKFSFQMLRKITELSKEVLMEIIDIGLSEFIIKESTVAEPLADDFFVFYHGTLRKVLYERLSGYRRRRLHAQIGDKLEALNPRKLERMASELAYHFYNGANYRKAVRYSMKAGEAARSIFAIEEAQKYYFWVDESLKQLEDAGEQIEGVDAEWVSNFRLAYGSVLMHLGRNDSAREQFELGLELSRKAGLVPLQGKILRALGELSWSRGHYKEALDSCERGLKFLIEAEDTGGQCRLFGVMGNIYFSQGLFDQAIEYYGKSLELARQVGDRPSEGEALRNIGSIMGWRNQSKSALEHLNQALIIARDVGDRESERQVMNLMGNIYLHQSELELAAEHYRQSLAIARAIGRRRGECRVALNIGELCRQQGDLEGAQTYFNEAQTIAAEIQDREIEGHALSNLGLALIDQSELDRALDCFQKALSIFRETQYRSHAEAEALSGIANILWQQDKVEDAKRYFEMAVSSGRALGLWNLVIPSLRCLATCEMTLEQPVAAKERLNEALAIIENLLSGNLPESESKHYLLIKSELIEELASF